MSPSRTVVTSSAGVGSWYRSSKRAEIACRTGVGGVISQTSWIAEETCRTLHAIWYIIVSLRIQISSSNTLGKCRWSNSTIASRWTDSTSIGHKIVWMVILSSWWAVISSSALPADSRKQVVLTKASSCAGLGGPWTCWAELAWDTHASIGDWLGDGSGRPSKTEEAGLTVICSDWWCSDCWAILSSSTGSAVSQGSHCGQGVEGAHWTRILAIILSTGRTIITSGTRIQSIVSRACRAEVTDGASYAWTLACQVLIGTSGAFNSYFRSCWTFISDWALGSCCNSSCITIVSSCAQSCGQINGCCWTFISGYALLAICESWTKLSIKVCPRRTGLLSSIISWWAIVTFLAGSIGSSHIDRSCRCWSRSAEEPSFTSSPNRAHFIVRASKHGVTGKAVGQHTLSSCRVIGSRGTGYWQNRVQRTICADRANSGVDCIEPIAVIADWAVGTSVGACGHCSICVVSRKTLSTFWGTDYREVAVSDLYFLSRGVSSVTVVACIALSCRLNESCRSAVEARGAGSAFSNSGKVGERVESSSRTGCRGTRSSWAVTSRRTKCQFRSFRTRSSWTIESGITCIVGISQSSLGTSRSSGTGVADWLSYNRGESSLWAGFWIDDRQIAIVANGAVSRGWSSWQTILSCRACQTWGNIWVHPCRRICISWANIIFASIGGSRAVEPSETVRLHRSSSWGVHSKCHCCTSSLTSIWVSSTLARDLVFSSCRTVISSCAAWSSSARPSSRGTELSSWTYCFDSSRAAVSSWAVRVAICLSFNAPFTVWTSCGDRVGSLIVSSRCW